MAKQMFFTGRCGCYGPRPYRRPWEAWPSGGIGHAYPGSFLQGRALQGRGATGQMTSLELSKAQNEGRKFAQRETVRRQLEAMGLKGRGNT